MRVAYILNVFPKISETFILNEMLAMQDKGVEVEVFAYKDLRQAAVHPRVKEIRNVTYFKKSRPILRLPFHLIFFLKNPIRYARTAFFVFNEGREGFFTRSGEGYGRIFVKEIRNIWAIHRARPDHIHAHFGEHGASDMAMIAGMLLGVPYSFTSHAHDIFDLPPKNYPVKSRLAKKHITISEYNKKYLVQKFGIREKDIDIIHCGVDFDRIPLWPAGEKDNFILTVARLYKEKGLDVLLRACAELRDDGVDFQCRIAGDGPERADLEKLIEQLKLDDRVQLLGLRTQNEVFSLLQKAKVKVLPSYQEGIPVALMEAMAMKVPVVATRITGVPELVEDGKCGFLVEAGDVKALKEKIKLLLTDKALRERFIAAGYKKVHEDFDLKTETDKLLKLWTKKP